MGPVLFTFYKQGVLKLKNNSGVKRLRVKFVHNLPMAAPTDSKETFCRFGHELLFHSVYFKSVVAKLTVHNFPELNVILRVKFVPNLPMEAPTGSKQTFCRFGHELLFHSVYFKSVVVKLTVHNFAELHVTLREKVVPNLPMEARTGSKEIILNLGTRWR